MALIHLIVAHAAICSLCVHAAPGDIIAEHPPAAETLLEVNPDAQAEGGARQKRWYTSYFGPPSFTSSIYPARSPDDSYLDIYRRLRDISTLIRTPDAPPPPAPVYVPVLFVPRLPGSFPCDCGARDATNGTDSTNGTKPSSVDSRFPDMDDTRQNWGIVSEDGDAGGDEDYSRPISFEPVRPDRPLARPPPPVEHGSSQGDVTAPSTPAPPGAAPGSPPAGAPDLPTACDGAILSCCHLPAVTLKCFTSQDCPDPTKIADNPCAPSVILSAVEKFRRFYSQRT